MTFWISTLVVGFVTTFLYRGAFILFKRTQNFPKVVEEFLDYIPIAAMCAIAAANIIFITEEDALVFAPDKIIAGCIAFIAAYLSKNLFVTLLVGMTSIWGITYLECILF